MLNLLLGCVKKRANEKNKRTRACFSLASTKGKRKQYHEVPHKSKSKVSTGRADVLFVSRRFFRFSALAIKVYYCLYIHVCVYVLFIIFWTPVTTGKHFSCASREGNI